MLKYIKTQIRIKLSKWKIEKFFSENKIEFVIAHYNEKIDYLNFFPKNSKITIYHKGETPLNKLILQENKNVEVINLSNIGRNPHTILYHIIKNYNNLYPLTFFLPGSFNSINPYKTKKKFAKIFNKIATSFPADYKGVYTSGSYRWWYHLSYFKKNKIKKYINEKFVLEKYQSSNKENVKFNPSFKLMAAKIRPMGEWYKHHFKDRGYAPVESMQAMFALKKKCITQHPIDKYKEIISQYSEIKVSYELEHYLERLFPSIFMR